jgi:hypothetical protein
MHTEVTNLPNLSGFLRFGRNLPVVRFADRFNDIPSTSAAFVERTAPPIRLVSATKLIKLARAESKVREAIEQEQRQGTAPTQPPPSADAGDAPAAAPQPDLFSSDGTPPIADELEVDDILNAPVGEMPTTPRRIWEVLAARQGDIKSELVQHGRADGPREPARPA